MEYGQAISFANILVPVTWSAIFVLISLHLLAIHTTIGVHVGSPYESSDLAKFPDIGKNQKHLWDKFIDWSYNFV